MYRTLFEEDDQAFDGFDFTTGYVYVCKQTWVDSLFCSVTFNGGRNPDIASRVLKEVQAINPQFQASQIRGKCLQLIIFYDVISLIIHLYNCSCYIHILQEFKSRGFYKAEGGTEQQEENS